MSILGDALGWIGFLLDHLWVVGVTVVAVLIGWIFGFLGSVSFGRRGRLYGAMVGGMIVNLVAKFEEASFLNAFVLMVAVTGLTFALGFVSNARVFKALKDAAD
jgi:hypothetical protein